MTAEHELHDPVVATEDPASEDPASEDPSAMPSAMPSTLTAGGAEPPSAPVFYARADPDAALAPSYGFLPLEKLGNVYAARLARPLVVQTPPLTLASALEDEDGQPAGHAYLQLPRAFADFAREVEDLVLHACLANKHEWFRRALSDDALRARFKEFCKASGHLKVRVPRDALVFDQAGQVVDRGQVTQGDAVRAILQLSRVCFGRTEFGAMWTLVQAQVAPPPPPPPKCLIDPSAEGCGDPAPDASAADADVDSEFL